MAVFLSKVHYLPKRVKTNQVYAWERKFIHTNCSLFKSPTFSEKSPALQKFKLKQAALQKDDGRPTFLKKGLPDKIIYNLTLAGVIIGFFLCYQSCIDLDNLTKGEE